MIRMDWRISNTQLVDQIYVCGENKVQGVTTCMSWFTDDLGEVGLKNKLTKGIGDESGTRE